MPASTLRIASAWPGRNCEMPNRRWPSSSMCASIESSSPSRSSARASSCVVIVRIDARSCSESSTMRSSIHDRLVRFARSVSRPSVTQSRVPRASLGVGADEPVAHVRSSRERGATLRRVSHLAGSSTSNATVAHRKLGRRKRNVARTRETRGAHVRTAVQRVRARHTVRELLERISRSDRELLAMQLTTASQDRERWRTYFAAR